MSFKTIGVSCLGVLIVVLGSLGCSDSEESSSSYKCCVNESYYECSSSEQMQTCGTSAMKCPRKSSKDSECK